MVKSCQNMTKKSVFIYFHECFNPSVRKASFWQQIAALFFCHKVFFFYVCLFFYHLFLSVSSLHLLLPLICFNPSASLQTPPCFHSPLSGSQHVCRARSGTGPVRLFLYRLTFLFGCHQIVLLKQGALMKWINKRILSFFLDSFLFFFSFFSVVVCFLSPLSLSCSPAGTCGPWP